MIPEARHSKTGRGKIQKELLSWGRAKERKDEKPRLTFELPYEER